MKKYTKFTDSDHEVKTFRWPFWLLPILFLSLVLVLGLFIFITIRSSDHFGCFFHCEQHTGQKIDNGGVNPPDFNDVRDDQNKTDIETPSKHTREHEKFEDKEGKVMSQQKLDQIRVYGNLVFPRDDRPASIPNDSLCKVTLKDVSFQDASSTEIASTIINVSLYRKGSGLTYEIKCARPSNMHVEWELDAILNMGWKANGDDWIKKGDYFVDTATPVSLVKAKSTYNVDIHLVKYN